MVRWVAPGGRTTGGGTQLGQEDWKALTPTEQTQYGTLTKSGRGAATAASVREDIEVQAQSRIAEQAAAQRVLDAAAQKDIQVVDDVIPEIVPETVDPADELPTFDTSMWDTFDPVGITNVNFDEFMQGLGGNARSEFLANWGMDSTTADWSKLPENMAEASHLQTWLRSNDPNIFQDPKTGRMKWNNKEIKEGAAIPGGLAEVLGIELGGAALTPGIPGGVLTAQDVANIQQAMNNFNAMETWTGELVAQGLDQQEHAWTTDVTVAANNSMATLTDMFNQNMAFANSQYQSQLAQIQAAETRKAERVRGEESRATLTHQYNLRQTELEDEYNRAKGMAEQERVTMLERIGKQMEAERTLIDRQHELDIDFREAELEFQSEQAALDRAIQEGQLDEAIRHNQNLEILDAQRNALDKDRLKVDMVTQISNNPAFLFYAKQSGMLDILADALGGVDSANEMYDALVGFVPADMSTQNIQEFNKMSQMEQSLQQFGLAASSGLTQAQQNQEMINQAPVDPRMQARFTKPEIRPGRGADPSQFDFSTEATLGAMEPVGGTRVVRRAAQTPAMAQRAEDTATTPEGFGLGAQGFPGQVMPTAKTPVREPGSTTVPKVLASGQQLFGSDKANQQYSDVMTKFPDMTLETFMFLKHVPNLASKSAKWVNSQTNAPAGQAAGASSVREPGNKTEAWKNQWYVKV
jgi:hypothetical protein